MAARGGASAAPLRVVAVSGSLHAPSKTSALVNEILAALSRQVDIEPTLFELSEIGPQFAGALVREELPASVEEVLRAIENADLLVVASPVYRASITGLFKHLFDFVGQYALMGKPVLLAATGGSDRHALIIEHQLRPLFGFFQALTLPLGVYASDADFTDYAVSSEALHERIETAISRGRPLIRRFEPVSPHVTGW
ncbi:FMN reductase [Microbacterium sp. STN6]|uniref:FMN reductase n=1 Tax=Microbacterium sp. STN6 TaxID=2995588 RepID=UPI002260FFA6|nr:FMN reductase [Microbacterium sp. STN6]MCX7521740.1 FMN reductase [Microbacterium sp. STN6]